MLMRRLEQDPDEQRQVDEALSRASTPTHVDATQVDATHERDTEEFDSREILTRLGQLPLCRSHLEHLFPLNRGLKLRDPPEHGWEPIDGQS